MTKDGQAACITHGCENQASGGPAALEACGMQPQAGFKRQEGTDGAQSPDALWTALCIRSDMPNGLQTGKKTGCLSS